MLQTNEATVDHWYMVIVAQQPNVTIDDVVLKLKGALTFTEGIGQIDVDPMGILEQESDDLSTTAGDTIFDSDAIADANETAGE